MLLCISINIDTTVTALDVDFSCALLCNETALAGSWTSSPRAHMERAVPWSVIPYSMYQGSSSNMSPHSELNNFNGYTSRIKPSSTSRNDPIYCWCINCFHNDLQYNWSLECNKVRSGHTFFLAMYFLHFSENIITILHLLFPIHDNTTGHSHFKT